MWLHHKTRDLLNKNLEKMVFSKRFLLRKCINGLCVAVVLLALGLFVYRNGKSDFSFTILYSGYWKYVNVPVKRQWLLQISTLDVDTYWCVYIYIYYLVITAHVYTFMLTNTYVVLMCVLDINVQMLFNA